MIINMTDKYAYRCDPETEVPVVHIIPGDVTYPVIAVGPGGNPSTHTKHGRFSAIRRDITELDLVPLKRKPRKPREWWVVAFGGGSTVTFNSKEAAKERYGSSPEIVHVIEVLDDAENHEVMK